MIALLLIALISDPFDRAIQAYEAGKPSQAFELFERVLQTDGHDRGPVLYNLGNCAYRMGDLPRAAWFYRRAALLLPEDPPLQHNLSQTEAKLGISSDAPQTNSIRVIADAVGALPLGGLLALIFALQMVGLVLWIRSPQKSTRIAGSFSIFLGLALGGLFARSITPPRMEGVVLKREISIRVEPHREMPVFYVLHGGESFEVLEMSERWVHVEHSRGRGWVERDKVGLVEP